MSTMPMPPQRHALGLPAGSVRALLVLMIVALTCLVLLVPSRQVMAIPPYLIYLLFLGLAHFFAAHGSSIGAHDQPSPLHFPRGSLRFIILLALAGTIAWKVYSAPASLQAQYEASLDELKREPFLPLIILGGFFLGILFRLIIRRASWYVIDDLEAWVALLAVLGLFVDAILQLIINPTLEKPLFVPVWNGILAGIVAFYFGARS